MGAHVDAGLSAADLATLREALAAGRRPKVVFTPAAGQIAGQFGQVAAVEGEPGGEVTVVVRFGRDELPFQPSDVAIPPRGAVAAARKAASATAVSAEVPAAGEEPSGPPLLPAAPTPRVAVEEGAEPPRPRRLPRPAKPKPAAAVTVTLTCMEGEWSVSAAQGSRTLARPCAVRPAEALRVVALLDVPALSEAVEQIVAAERARARERVDRLRAELAEVEARLAELPAGA